MIKNNKAHKLAVLSATSILFAAGVTQIHADSNKGEVTADSLNIRSGPSISHSVIGGLKKGNKVEIISCEKNWYNIKYGSKTGWVSGSYILIKNSETTRDDQNLSKNNKKLIAIAGLNVRSGASTKYKKIGYIAKNETVDMLGVASSGWYKVKLSDGTVGYASNLYLNEITNSSNNNENKGNDINDNDVSVKNTLIATSNLNLRSGPSTSYNTLGVIYKGDKVSVIEYTSDYWYKVKLSNGKVGYCSSLYLKSQSQIDSITNKPSSSQDIDYTLDVKAYAYCTGNITATGTKPTFGRTIAVDPTVIPYGTRVYIPEFDKTFIAEDCGGGIKGNKIDIYMNTKEECTNWGVRNITLYILK